jgi:hypothetical protein
MRKRAIVLSGGFVVVCQFLCHLQTPTRIRLSAKDHDLQHEQEQDWVRRQVRSGSKCEMLAPSKCFPFDGAGDIHEVFRAPFSNGKLSPAVISGLPPRLRF